MTHAVMAVGAAIIGFILVLFVAAAGYRAMHGGDAVSAMWDMMDDWNGMMGDGGMHGMMGRGGGPSTTGSASGAGAVRIVDFSFQPTALNVTPGTTVTWTNEDSAPHTATGDDFDTGKLDKGDSGAVTFDTSGTYDYICTYHPNMEGRIIVAADASS
jgi:plastocyanin